ncbi:MAG: putative 4-hydroxybenzoate polyprenyltransferase [Fibrobacter sp.]|uniref:4-hydroxybenzoate octaprenyltransferase n=1 Tax=Hallerella succinigenes TaxID=1896222 RepID=UPI0023F1FD41|nr:4-hydroxybenzoate octaprenyltransferase [Hallerella succinigenes]MBS7391787.1 putative 4-hydroxybenzoate polyprenyltransferase [Fibrobacter sp.]MDD6091792.1 putative 4-hydroxybenzoate polyprenyltransferase [Hallerella succinigenes]
MSVLSKIGEYGRMVRFSHSLFAMPFAIGSMWVAANGFRGMDVLQITKFVLLIVGCMVTARNSSMSFNRLVDAKFDAENPRTSKRHLVTGALSKKAVIGFIAVNAALFCLLAWLLNPLAGIFSFPVLCALAFYSYWKRFSWLCHWYLGFAIGMSPLGAWIAVRGEFAAFPIFLMFILMLWMGGFDIIYATQDEEIDKRQGLHSVPARFGRAKALKIALASHLAMLALCAIFGVYWQMGIAWWSVFALMAAAILYIHLFRKSDDLDAMNRDFFLANVGISVLVMLGLIVWILLGGDVNALR